MSSYETVHGCDQTPFSAVQIACETKL